MRRWQAVLALTLLAGCGKHGTPAPVGGTAVAPSKVVLQRNVDLATVQQRPLVSRVETIGVLEAEGQTDIAAGVSGVIDQVFFREGDEVQAGTLLVTIEQDRYTADESLARANVERAKANLDLSKDLADRADRLRSGQALSEEERVKARGQLRIAEAEHRSALAAHVRAKHNLERSRVHAPYPGRINKRLVTRGTYLEEKTPIATIADLSHIRLVGFVPESAAPVLRDLLSTQDARLAAARVGLLLAGTSPLRVATGACLVQADMVASGYDPEFEIMALPGQPFLARIFYMSTVANPDTHMFETKAEVLGWRPDTPPDPPAAAATVAQLSDPAAPLRLPVPTLAGRRATAAQPTLWPGFTAKIRFPLRSAPSAAVIPEEAVRNTERGFIVFVPTPQTRDGKTEWIARSRTLELGYRGEGWIEVRQGLTIGERIVHRGAEALEDGTPIRVGGAGMERR